MIVELETVFTPLDIELVDYILIGPRGVFSYRGSNSIAALAAG